MNYTKPPLDLAQQADLLLSRGMVGERDLMIKRLGSVSYYRLSGYWYPFRNFDDTFVERTSFDEIWNRYVFDRRLRLLVMDAIERVEIAVRTRLALHHSLTAGAFGYAETPSALPKYGEAQRAALLNRMNEEVHRSREVFVEHFRKKYGSNHLHLPIWMAIEVMSFGTILTFYRSVSRQIKQEIASGFLVPSRVFDSWLLTLNTVRNVCAHHGRLWNREIGTKPLIPLSKDYPEWHIPVSLSNNRVFCVLTILKYCLGCIAPQSHWVDRLHALLNEYPGIPLVSMGFPSNWRSSRIWDNN